MKGIALKETRKIVIKGIRRISRVILNLFVRVMPYKNGLNSKMRDEKIIISMTSYPARFAYIVLPIKSLLLQSIKPDKIIVWLGSDSSEDDLSEEMKKLREYGVEYRFDPERNLKPHKKYFYALQEYCNDLVITVDDDIIYPPTLVSSLLKMHRKYPTAICARRVHKVKVDQTGAIDSYTTWEWECDKKCAPSYLLFGTNGAGTLFPPHVFKRYAFDEERIKMLCLNADDVWIWFMSLMNQRKIVWAPCYLIHPPVVEETRAMNSLAMENIENRGNDKYIKEMLAYYPISETIMSELN